MPRQRVLHPLPVFDEPLLLEAFREERIKPEQAQRVWKHCLKTLKQHTGAKIREEKSSKEKDDEEEKGEGEGEEKGEEKREHKLTEEEIFLMERKREEKQKEIAEMIRDLTPWSKMQHFPAAGLKVLDEKFTLFTTKVVEDKTSADGTTKLLIELQDGQRVESVIITHQKRVTLCLSSQVGCAMGCTFCATGTLGLRGNLTSGEIIEQLVHANMRRTITNVVFMGMGEPLHNYDEVLASIKVMVDTRRFALAKTRVTVSTVGIIPKMIKLTEDAPYVSLALSLHAPNQELRAEIVPSAKTYTLDKLIEAMDYYIETLQRSVFVEYVLLADVNDKEEHAHELGNLLKGKKVHVNLIPYNPTDVIYQFRRPERSNTTKFAKILQEQYRLFTTVRKEMGDDVAAACGQLSIKGYQKAQPPEVKLRHKDKKVKSSESTSSSSSSCSSEQSDIEDLMSGTGGSGRNGSATSTLHLRSSKDRPSPKSNVQQVAKGRSNLVSFGLLLFIILCLVILLIARVRM